MKASLLSLRAKSAGRENVGRAMRTISLEEGTRVRTGSRGEKNPETWWSAALAKSGTSGAMPQVSSVSASSARAWNTTDVLNQIVGRLAIAVEESSSRAQLVLRPPELGRVVMDLNLNSSQLDLTVSVEHPHVKELLQSSISELEAALREKGLELGTFSIGVDLGTERRDSSSHAGRSSQGVRRAGVTMPVQPGSHAETGTVRAVWEPWLGNAGIDCFA